MFAVDNGEMKTYEMHENAGSVDGRQLKIFWALSARVIFQLFSSRNVQKRNFIITSNRIFSRLELISKNTLQAYDLFLSLSLRRALKFVISN